MPVTNYFWDMESDNVLMEKDETGATTAVYTHEPGEFGKLISQRRDSQTYFHHFDAQGSTRAVTDENQNVVETATYSAFGEVVEKTSSIVNPLGYKGALGYYANPGTNDIYVRARTYEPFTTQWLSVDPLGFVDGPNRHLYVANDPVNIVDPSGLFLMFICIPESADYYKTFCRLCSICCCHWACSHGRGPGKKVYNISGPPIVHPYVRVPFGCFPFIRFRPDDGWSEQGEEIDGGCDCPANATNHTSPTTIDC